MAISILFVFLLPVFIRTGIDVEQNYVTVSLCIFIFDFGTVQVAYLLTSFSVWWYIFLCDVFGRSCEGSG